MATWTMLAGQEGARIVSRAPATLLFQADALRWVEKLPEDSIHGIATDPPYGLIEYEAKDHAKLRRGLGGVWRIPPSFDGARRAPLPRFTVLTVDDRQRLELFFGEFARGLPGACWCRAGISSSRRIRCCPPWCSRRSSGRGWRSGAR